MNNSFNVELRNRFDIMSDRLNVRITLKAIKKMYDDTGERILGYKDKQRKLHLSNGTRQGGKNCSKHGKLRWITGFIRSMNKLDSKDFRAFYHNLAAKTEAATK
jgi:hypothetical protein